MDNGSNVHINNLRQLMGAICTWHDFDIGILRVKPLHVCIIVQKKKYLLFHFQFLYQFTYLAGGLLTFRLEIYVHEDRVLTPKQRFPEGRYKQRGTLTILRKPQCAQLVKQHSFDLTTPVGGAVDGPIVNHHQFTILRFPYIKLYDVRSNTDRLRDGRERIFRKKPVSA